MTGQSPPTVEGQAAAIRGEPKSACPYSVATPEGRAWHRAWLTAESYRQHQSGEAERRTLDQRAEAHRLAAVWEPARYDVNPVDVLLAEVAAVDEPEPGLYDEGGDLSVRWTWTPPPAPSLPWSDPAADPMADLRWFYANARGLTIPADPTSVMSIVDIA